MFIPNSVPSALAEMLAFLEPAVSDGLFDSVAYDDQSSPTKIVCTQGGNVILDVVYGASGSWGFIPYIAQGVAASQNMHYVPAGSRTWASACRCKGGIYFIDSDNQIGWAIAKTTNGQTGFICHALDNPYTTFVPTRFGDDTALRIYQSGWQDFWYAGNASDRTALTKIPVAGTNGCTDCFTTVFIRKMVQFRDNGVQMIGGKKYGCIGLLAIFDGDGEESA